MNPPLARTPEWDVKIRELEVLARAFVTPLMVRITLGGPGTEGFESHTADEHVKLVFPDADTGLTRPPRQVGSQLEWPRPFPPTREYTIRRFDAAAHEIDIDFVVHEGGLAPAWALEAPIGSTIWVAGPRPTALVPDDFTFHVRIGDETALPAIGRWLEELPAPAKGIVAVEVASPDEEQALTAPDGVSITWLHRGNVAAADSRLLAEFMDRLELPNDERVYVWAAGEAGALKPIRRWATAHGFARGTCDISGYWRRGVLDQRV
ncbi:siderophore-interacting protein [soil metagenome]